MSKLKWHGKADPTFLTAVETPRILAAAGDPICKKMMKHLRLHKENQLIIPGLDEADESFASFDSLSVRDRIALTRSAIVQYRFQMLNSLALDMGFRNVLDLGAGMTSRGASFSSGGINYVGGDLPLTTHLMEKEMNRYAASALGLLAYLSVDVTNPAYCMAAARQLGSPLCILTEDLLEGLTEDEKGLLLQNIQAILREHGGCWISLYPWQNALEEIFTLAIHSSNPIFLSSEKEEKVFSSVPGFLEEPISFYSEEVLERMSVWQFLGEAQKRALKEGLSDFTAVKVTLDPDSAPLEVKRRSCVAEESGSMLMLVNGILYVKLVGRLDSISTPDLLESFEKLVANEEIKSIRVDAASLDYISSAGLRILMKMIKRSENKTIRVIGASEEIMEIFRKTAFADWMEFS